MYLYFFLLFSRVHLELLLAPGYKYKPPAIVTKHTINQIQVTYFFGPGHPLGVGVE